MIDVRCYNRQRAFGAKEMFPIIRETAEHVLFSSTFVKNLLEEGIDVVLDVTTVGPRVMRRINREQRGVDATTDVLSFPAREMREDVLKTPLKPWEIFAPGDRRKLFLGEIVLSPDRAVTQAEALNHSFQRELMFLTIHGVLHLLGYDHQSEKDASTMEALQRRFIRDLEEIPSGFVALCGRPNVGKSTLINRLSGRTLAIESPKPQTTRHAIRSVLSSDQYEIAFLDMPGLHKPDNALGRAMVRTVMQSIRQSDIVALMINAAWRPFIGESERRILDVAKKDNKTTFLLINQIDCVPKEKILPLIALYDREWHPDACIPISAKTGDGLDALIEEIIKYLPVRRRMFQEGDETDQTERILASELIRREILRQTEKEIPYGVAVNIRTFEEQFERPNKNPQNTEGQFFNLNRKSDKTDEIQGHPGESSENSYKQLGSPQGQFFNFNLKIGQRSTNNDDVRYQSGNEGERTGIRIEADIICDNLPHKKILVGHNGRMIRSIGTEARLAMEALFDAPVYLRLFVKVRPNWQNRLQDISEVGILPSDETV